MTFKKSLSAAAVLLSSAFVLTWHVAETAKLVQTKLKQLTQTATTQTAAENLTPLKDGTYKLVSEMTNVDGT